MPPNHLAIPLKTLNRCKSKDRKRRSGRRFTSTIIGSIRKISAFGAVTALYYPLIPSNPQNVLLTAHLGERSSYPSKETYVGQSMERYVKRQAAGWYSCLAREILTVTLAASVVISPLLARSVSISIAAAECSGGSCSPRGGGGRFADGFGNPQSGGDPAGGGGGGGMLGNLMGQMLPMLMMLMMMMMMNKKNDNKNNAQALPTLAPPPTPLPTFTPVFTPTATPTPQPTPTSGNTF